MKNNALNQVNFFGNLHNELDKIDIKNNEVCISSLSIKEPNYDAIKNKIKENSEDELYSNMLQNKLNILNLMSYKELLNIMNENSKKLVHGDVYLDNIIFNENR